MADEEEDAAYEENVILSNWDIPDKIQRQKFCLFYLCSIFC